MRRGGGGGAPSECLATPLLMFVGVGRFNYDRGFLCQLSVPPQKPGRVWKEWVMRNSWAESVSNTSWSGEQVRMEVTLVLYLWIASQSLGMAQRLRRSLGSGRVLECFFFNGAPSCESRDCTQTPGIHGDCRFVHEAICHSEPCLLHQNK